LCDRGDLVGRRPLHDERDEETRDLHVGDLVVAHVLHELGHLRTGQALALGQLAERLLEHPFLLAGSWPGRGCA
jgi:hypothetical protein